jgi:signal transduction histidine kinase
LILLSLLTVFGLFEYYTYRVSINELQNRISDMARSQSEVIAESLWHLDNERINVILKAIMVDRDVVAASVDDELGKPLAAIGKPGKFADIPGHTHRHEITFRSTDRDEVIGNLIIIHGDATIVENAKRRLISGALLCVLLLVSAVISALVANWRTIGVPMGRLLGAIKAAEQSGTHETVDWKVRDEFGDLVAAFNRMQRQQQRYETELTEAREDLERRVEERTGELRQAQDEAETANRAKTQFLQGMSHELRTPLNAILGFSDMIRMQAMRPGSEIEYAGDINKSAHFLLDIVNDLLDLSRI